MCRRVRVTAYSLVVILGLASWGIDNVAAEPSAFSVDTSVWRLAAAGTVDGGLAVAGALGLVRVMVQHRVKSRKMP